MVMGRGGAAAVGEVSELPPWKAVVRLSASRLQQVEVE